MYSIFINGDTTSKAKLTFLLILLNVTALVRAYPQVRFPGSSFEDWTFLVVSGFKLMKSGQCAEMLLA